MVVDWRRAWYNEENDGTGEADCMDAFLMIGQSNMAGRGPIGDVPEIDPTNKLFMLRNGRWQLMGEPVNPDRRIFVTNPNETRSGVSLMPSFAKAYADAIGEPVGMIPCAEGGTCIDEWAEGGVLFDNAVFQTKLAMRSARLKGICWHQGESDSDRIEDVRAYADKFHRFIAALKREIGVSHIPVIIGELSHNYGPGAFPFAPQMNEVLHSIAASSEEYEIVPADGLVIGPDRAHFTSSSYREFGRRYFDAYQRLCARLEK